MARISRGDAPLYVYFARDLVTGFIKIGYSWNPARRIRSLRRETDGHSIELLAVARGNHLTEGKLHHLFRDDLAGRGREWFRSSPALEALIEFIREFQAVKPSPVAGVA